MGEDGPPAGDRMKLGGESWISLQIHKLMAIISARTTITSGTWDVRTVFKAGKIA